MRSSLVSCDLPLTASRGRPQAYSGAQSPGKSWSDPDFGAASRAQARSRNRKIGTSAQPGARISMTQMTDSEFARLEEQAEGFVRSLRIPGCPEILARISREVHAQTPDLRKVA